jgi:beta-lactamase superfamily II metal-dependent hydrolase
MEIAGWKNLLKDPAFVRAIGEVNVFVASHHGRENGCCEELFSQTNLKPAVVIISDSGIQHATQETVAWYRSRVKGIPLNGETRHVITTRSDGRVLIEATPNGITLDVTKRRRQWI